MVPVYQVLSPSDIDKVYSFAEKRLRLRTEDETSRTFEIWHARWRREALEHYLKLGWSMGLRDEEQEDSPLKGFFLAQPLLFFRGQTQTLWVEYLEAVDKPTQDALVDLAVRLAREKHLQRTLFFDADSLESSLAKWQAASFSDFSESIKVVQTTKG